MKVSVKTLFAAVLTSLLCAGPFALAHQGHATIPTVKFEASDYAFSGPAQLQTGLVSLEFSNTGQEPHHLQLVRLADGVTFEELLAALQENEAEVLGQLELVGGVGVLLPGANQAVTVELQKPGTYLVLCFVPNGEGIPHLALGMASTIEVVGETIVAERPQVDLTVDLIDYELNVPDEIQAGIQTWEVLNDGPEPHEMMLARLLPGKTMADVEAFFQNPQAEMPFAFAGGVQALTPGLRNYITLDLEPGEYIALCFIPSHAMGGAPHFALGMVKPFTVVTRTATN